MPIRLNKVAREFNIGLQTIIDYLGKKGFTVDPNLNAKLSDEAYQIVKEHFGTDKTLRSAATQRQSEKNKNNTKEQKVHEEIKTVIPKEELPKIKTVGKINLGSNGMPEETPTYKATDKQQNTDKNEVPKAENKPTPEIKVQVAQKEVVKKEEITDTQKAEQTQTAKAEKTAEVAKEEKAETPKPVKTETAKAEKAAEVAEEEKAETPKPVKTITEKAEKAAEIAKEEKNEVLKSNRNENTNATSAKEKKTFSPAPSPKKEETKKPQKSTEGNASVPVQSEKNAGKPKSVEVKKDEPEKHAEPEKEDVFRVAPKPTLTGPKVLGTIDLTAINENMRPRKKTKEEKRKEREDKNRQVPTASAAPAGNNNGQKKKRNRVSGSKVDIKAEVQKATDEGRNNNNNNRRNGQQNQNRQQQNGGNQQFNGRNNKKQQQQQQQQQNAPKPQISDEDVAKEVKKTLARLTGKKNFSNSAKYRREKRDQVRAAAEERMNEESRESKILKLTEFVTANELANMMEVPVTQVIGTCMSIGMMISINQRMDAETINLVAEEFGFKTEYVSASVSEAVQEEEDNEDDLEPREPIVTIMGHVDHGKTSLLDYIRNSNVIAGEAGGITQHIGAYNVKLDSDRRITFLDTPGHEAFTAMRARGAQVTDIAIIIIAADDDVMPQTKEAINHAVAANVPIVFAINKVDKPTANPEKIKETLANMNFLVEDWGGKYQSQDISAKKGIGVNELLEKVLLEADMLELKANPNRRATGTIIESSLDKGRGYVATILVSNGTLRIGDYVVAGTCYGRVKDLSDERGRHIKEVGPARAAILLGFNGAPQAGDTFHVMKSEQEAREIATKRLQLQREQSIRTSHRTTLEEIGNRIAMGGIQELNIIVKGDVDGSVEALSDALIKLSTKKIVVNVIHKAVGQIIESDISLAAASQAIIIGFQVRPSAQARKEAEQSGIDIRLYSIIYDAIHDVKSAMEGMLKPIIKEEETGSLEVRQVYHISKVGTVAGAFVLNGKVQRTDKARLVREGIVIFTGEINALKRFKDDVKEVNQNFECGISLQGFNDILEGDIIETFKEIEIKQKL